MIFPVDILYILSIFTNVEATEEFECLIFFPT